MSGLMLETLNKSDVPSSPGIYNQEEPEVGALDN